MGAGAAGRPGVVLPAGVSVRAALGIPVDLGRPEGKEVLRAHLAVRGVKTGGAEHAPWLGGVLGRGTMADLADLAVLTDQAGKEVAVGGSRDLAQGGPGGA